MKGHTSGPELFWEKLESPGQCQHFKSAFQCTVMAPLQRAFFQVEAPLCFAVGLEKSAVACAQRRGKVLRYLEPVVGSSFPARGEGAAGTQALF